MKELGDSSQQRVHGNCSVNLALPRAVSVRCDSVHPRSVHCLSEARDTCTIPPSSDAAAAIEVHRTP